MDTEDREILTSLRSRMDEMMQYPTEEYTYNDLDAFIEVALGVIETYEDSQKDISSIKYVARELLQRSRQLVYEDVGTRSKGHMEESLTSAEMLTCIYGAIDYFLERTKT
ncbi:hypothetical protein QNI16_17550 [Cytophagaceae bacterium YF14B1]|uniref:Uncharacterized protein n=1 Tax=Xanthocytophaga flava TaxID=3048013 RepID=A0AAE3QRR9_9BACT|nr:hypothetical protein [Xanthocytophaga flavus]MDJ1482315.1 hypothetical protein [Xanthocytophaga flavus]